jgi:beta-carotene 3-hydroxylase
VPKGRYLKRVVQAHRMHHAVQGREGCVSFGFIYAAPIEQLKAELRARNPDLSKSAARALEVEMKEPPRAAD